MVAELLSLEPKRSQLKRKHAARESGSRSRQIGNGARGPSSTKRGRPRKKRKGWGEQSSDEDESDNAIPEYLQKRRGQFDRQAARLKEAGLKIPPTYDDVPFSDDEDLESVETRPAFQDRKPVRPCEDKDLPLSLGLIPASIAQWLRDYQVEGVAFLHKLFVYQTGGILGDDMGLGKTVQVIAFLTAAFGKTGDMRDAKRMRKMRRINAEWYPRVLLVCPGGLISNWQEELRRWGWWHVDVYHGQTKEEAYEAAKAGRLEIMITTYSTYRNSKDEINTIEWDCVVVDECHMLKGKNSETTKAMNEVNALCRIGLTGTAIQNDYQELWALLNWTNLGRFGPLSEWRRTISGPLMEGQSHEATQYQLGLARKTAFALVNNLLPQFFLRRMKSLIADQLPKKSDRVVFCPLTETQAEAYERFLDSDVVQTIKNSSTDCNCGSGKKAGWCCDKRVPEGGPWQSYVFPAMINLQKICNHLALLIPQGGDAREKQEKDMQMLQDTFPEKWREMYQSRGSMKNFADPDFCGKWKVLKKLLKFWHDAGDKVLVFSRSVRLLNMLRLLFQSTSYIVSYLTGQMSYEERAREVDRFNADADQFVFLISTRAGGVGLNITAANKVVVVDPDWNPAVDLQAQDRAYRIGQARDVEVFRLVSAGTIEEIVYARQIYKQQQASIAYTASHERRYFRGVKDRPEQRGEIFGLQNLFEYVGEHLVLRDIVNKTNVAESRAGVDMLEFDASPSQQSRSTEAADENHEADDDPLLASADEDAAMSQLAKLVSAGDADAFAGSSSAAKAPAGRSRGKRRAAAGKSNPIEAILSGAGVSYTHENADVVGSSRVEAHLSRRAEQAGQDADFGQQPVFAQIRPTRRSMSRGGDNGGVLDDLDDDDLLDYRYDPPEDVQRRHFCTMAQTFGFRDATDFALVVEGWTQAQRRACLERFYRLRREKLGAGRQGSGEGDAPQGAVEISDHSEAVSEAPQSEAPQADTQTSWVF